MNICIASYYNEAFRRIANRTTINFAHYSTVNGYDLHIGTYNLVGSRPPSWNKLALIRQLLPNYDWVFWIDVDALFLQMGVRIESFLDERYDAILGWGHDGENRSLVVNCGVMAIRNSSMAKRLLSEVDKQTQFDNHPWWDQAAFNFVLQRNKRWSKRVLQIPRARINSFPHEVNEESFIVHAAGAGGEFGKFRVLEELFWKVMAKPEISVDPSSNKCEDQNSRN